MIFEDLNQAQKEAVEKVGGPILVFAGAGSGKTRVLTHKIGYLINEIGIPPQNILAVTFTNKAASEMKSRVQSIVSSDASKVNVGTFHSICAGILRRQIHKIGYTNDFTIYDQNDSKSLLKEVVKNLNFDLKTFDPRTCQIKISQYKNKLQSPENVASLATDIFEERISLIYEEYQKKLKAFNSVDFDDLLLLPLQLFKESIDTLEFYQSQFQYILVDEYQDTNMPQFEFIYNLSKVHKEICVVGDDDQSIYGWRGADINNILNFKEAYGDATTIKLEQNYRSTKVILEAAWSVVSRNVHRADKKLWTDNKSGEKINVNACDDEKHEARKILSIIQDKTKEGMKLNDFVVLYRTNQQSRAIEDVLRRGSIPYQIVGGIKFYDRKEIKDMLAYLRLAVNPKDEVSFQRVVNFPHRGVGKTSVEKIISFAEDKGIHALDALSKISEINIGKKQKQSLNYFFEIIKKITLMAKDSSPIEVVTQLITSLKLKEYYIDQDTSESADRWLNIEELISSIQDYTDMNKDSSLSMFLEEVSLLTDIDRWNDQNDCISLMTVHSAKGLEFPVVFVCGMEEMLFPHASYLESDSEMDEERRLFYVALTRSMQRVYLLYAMRRLKFGSGYVSTSPSRFLSEIPLELLDYNKQKVASFKKKSFFSSFKSGSKNIDFSPNTKVEHGVFGQGVVLSVEGVGEEQKLTVRFRGRQIKKLIKKYANLKKL